MNHMKQTIKHLHEIAAEASVQYNDLTGIIRLDGHSHFDYASLHLRERPSLVSFYIRLSMHGRTSEGRSRELGMA